MFDIEVIIIIERHSTTPTTAPRPTVTNDVPRQPATPPTATTSQASSLQILEELSLAHWSW